MKKLFIPVIFLLIFLPLVASAEKINDLEVEWGDSTDYTLSWTNPKITKGDYVIKVIDFNWKGSAVVTVTRNGETQHGVLSEGENSYFNFTKNTTYFQGVRIYPKTVSNFHSVPASISSEKPVNIGTYPCCPAAEITVTVSKEITKKPVLELVISPNWDGRSGVSSTMEIDVKNTGNADFSEGNISINISGLKIANEQELSDYALTYNSAKSLVTRGWSIPLLANNTYYVNLSVKPPFPPDPNKSTYTIKVDSVFKDNTGKIYPVSSSKIVSLNPAIELTKRIIPSTMLPLKTYGGQEIDIGFLTKFFGLGKVTVVNIHAKNSQSYSVKSIMLNETIMENFILADITPPTAGYRLIDNETRFQWVFDLNASDTKEFRYELLAQKTGTFTAPAAVAQWNEWGVSRTTSSDRPATRVYGVFVVLSKKTDRPAFKLNESLNVTLNLENIGDFPVGINVTDVLPKNTTLLSGTIAYSGFLYPKELVVLKYNLSAGFPEELELPSPQVTFWKKEYDGSYGFIAAQNVTVLEPSAVLPSIINISQNVTPGATITPLPKSLLEIVGEKAPWLEGAIPIVMLFIAIILILMLHVINRES